MCFEQAESVLVDYSPRHVVVISSSVPQSEILLQACRPEVLTLIYVRKLLDCQLAITYNPLYT